MKKNLLAVLLAAATVAAMAVPAMAAETESDIAVNEAAAADPAVTLVMAEVNPLDTIVGMTDSEFKRQVEGMSGGSITVDLRDSGVLGSENDVLDAMLGGDDSIDMSRISAFALTNYGCKKATLLSIPYTFSSRDHWWKFATSDLADEFLAEPEELGLGVRGIYYGEEGFRHFFTKKEVAGIEDFKDMKLRVSNDPIMNGMCEGLGAIPTVVSFGELYSALNSGVVDGAEQPIANYYSNSFQEVAPNLILDGHTLGAIQVVISDTAWGKLTENQQQVLMDAGAVAETYNQNLSQEKEDEVLKTLKDAGVNVVDVPDKTPWREAAQSSQAIADAISANQDLYDQILAMDE